MDVDLRPTLLAVTGTLRGSAAETKRKAKREETDKAAPTLEIVSDVSYLGNQPQAQQRDCT